MKRSRTLVCWNGRNNTPFLFVDANGVEDRMCIIAPFDASYLHGRYTKTVGDVRTSHQDFRRNVDAIIDREGSVHRLLRSMHSEGASARDVAIFADVLHRNDVAVAQPLSQIVIDTIDSWKDVRFSDAPGAKAGPGRDLFIFGDDIDDHGVDACIVARAPYDPVRVTFPDGKRRHFPIGRYALSALIQSLRAINSDALHCIAAAGPIYADAIPESLRASIDVRLHSAIDMSTVRPAIGSYTSLNPTLHPVVVSMDATIAVVRSISDEAVVEVPVMVDMPIPISDLISVTHYASRMPTCDDIEQSLNSYARSDNGLAFILSHDAERLRAFASLSMPEQVLELANIFRRDIRNLVEETTVKSRSERYLTGETAYLYFPLALHALSEWTIDNDTAFASIEGVLHQTGVESMTFERLRRGIWRLRLSGADCGESVMILHIDDN
jgi:hypothetical protein